MFFIKHVKIDKNIDTKNYDQQKYWGGGVPAIAPLASLLHGP